MTDEYLEQRRRYVQEIRNSFSEEDLSRQAKGARLRAGAELEREEDELDTVGSSAVWKVKLILSLMLFAAFVLCDRTGTKLFSMNTDTIAEKVGEDQKLPKQVEETLKSVFLQLK